MADTIKTYWDAPLEIEWDLHIPLLRRSIKNAAPMDSGALRRSFDRPGVITFNESEMAIDIHISDPTDPAYYYAKIQNEGSGYLPGGKIPAFDIRKARPKPGMMMRPYKKVMRAFIAGAWRFFTKRKAFSIRGSDYVYKGVVQWSRELQYKLSGGTVVTWASGEAGKTFGRNKGRFRT